MIYPNKKVIEMLEELRKVANSYIIGRSLISESSKDIDFVVFGSKDEYNRIADLAAIGPYRKKFIKTKYISDDFPWNNIIKGKNEDFEFDILFCDFESNMHDVLVGFPITMQHIAFDGDFLFSEHFEDDVLELSPKRRQRTLSKGLRGVMKKYCEYYPDHDVGDLFFDVLKQIAFEGTEQLKEVF